jgi:hypothetical protein
MLPNCIAHFPTREEVLQFIQRQAPFINVVRINDFAELHPDEFNYLRFSVLYQLRRKHDPRKGYALDSYGNIVPESW